MKGDKTNERLIILFLGAISVACILAIVVLLAVNGDSRVDALVTIASLCAGALASRVSQSGTPKPPVEDYDYSMIGRAATKGLIAEAIRQLGEGDERG